MRENKSYSKAERKIILYTGRRSVAALRQSWRRTKSQRRKTQRETPAEHDAWPYPQQRGGGA